MNTKYVYNAVVMNANGDVVREKSCKTEADARAFISRAKVRGCHPDVLTFDEAFVNDEKQVLASFASPSLAGWNQMIGTITREEV